MENLNQRLESLIRFRKELHKNPELSGKEIETAKRIVSFLEQYPPDEMQTNVGGTGIIAVYKGAEEGKSILFRCELDALPIKETNSFEHKSVKKLFRTNADTMVIWLFCADWRANYIINDRKKET